VTSSAWFGNLRKLGETEAERLLLKSAEQKTKLIPAVSMRIVLPGDTLCKSANALSFFSKHYKHEAATRPVTIDSALARMHDSWLKITCLAFDEKIQHRDL